jgi:hypothetical protein
VLPIVPRKRLMLISVSAQCLLARAKLPVLDQGETITDCGDEFP